MWRHPCLAYGELKLENNCAAGCWIMRRRWLPFVSGGKRQDSDAASNVAPLAAARLLRLTALLLRRPRRRRPRRFHHLLVRGNRAPRTSALPRPNL